MLENIQVALQGVKGHKLRSFLTMLGVIIGIASIITIVATIKGTNEQIKEQLIGAGNNAVIVQLYQNDGVYMMDYQNNPDGVSVIEDSAYEELEALDGVKKVAFYRERSYADGVYYKNTSLSPTIVGADARYMELYGYNILKGRNFSQADFDNFRKVVLLDQTSADTLFGSKDPIGETIEIKGETFTVIGVVVKNKTTSMKIETVNDYYMYADTSSSIFVPETTWPIIYRYDEPQSVAVMANSTDEMTTAGMNVANWLTENQINQLAENNKFSYKSQDLLERAEKLQEMSNSTSRQLIWIAGISLLVGGVGVMNIMLVTVTERTSEIGLKKAIGAKRRRILAQFLTEAAVLTGIGGFLGALCGVGLAGLISKFMGTPTSISVPSVLIAVAFSIVIGIVFGLFPAVRASKLNPIQALRRE